MPLSLGRAGRKQPVIATGFTTFIHYFYSFHTRTDQPAGFPEVTKETAVQRESQLISLAQL